MTVPTLLHLIFMAYLGNDQRNHSDSHLYSLGKGNLVIYRTHHSDLAEPALDPAFPIHSPSWLCLFPSMSSAGSLWRAACWLSTGSLSPLCSYQQHCFWFHCKAIFFKQASSIYWVTHFLLKYSAIKFGYNLLSFNLQRNVELKNMQNYYFDWIEIM